MTTDSLRTRAIRHADEADRLGGTPRVATCRNQATLALAFAMLDNAAASRLLAGRMSPAQQMPPDMVQAHIDAGGCI